MEILCLFYVKLQFLTLHKKWKIDSFTGFSNHLVANFKNSHFKNLISVARRILCAFHKFRKGYVVSILLWQSFPNSLNNTPWYDFPISILYIHQIYCLYAANLRNSYTVCANPPLNDKSLLNLFLIQAPVGRPVKNLDFL